MDLSSALEGNHERKRDWDGTCSRLKQRGGVLAGRGLSLSRRSKLPTSSSLDGREREAISVLLRSYLPIFVSGWNALFFQAGLVHKLKQ